MARVNKLKGIHYFSIGMIILATTNFISCLDLGFGISVFYSCLDVAALLIIGIGIFPLGNYTKEFSLAKKALVVAIVLDILLLIPLFIKGGGQNIGLSIGALLGTIIGFLIKLAIGVLVLHGCGEIGAEQGSAVHQKNCQKTGKIFLLVSGACLLALLAGIFLMNTHRIPLIVTIVLVGVASLAVTVALVYRVEETCQLEETSA
ncbi:MAG: hypothetical protein RR626_03930 [Anaerovoracaceae bacterium]